MMRADQEHHASIQQGWYCLGAAALATTLVVALVIRGRNHFRPLTPSSVVGLNTRLLCTCIVIYFKRCWTSTSRMSQRRKMFCAAVVFLVYGGMMLSKRYTGFGSASSYYLRSMSPYDDNMEAVLDNQRELLAAEMKGYDYQQVGATSLDDLVPEMGGQPIRSVILTSWRSGSTFLGAILNSHPANFYHFEPLRYFVSQQIRGELEAEFALKDLKGLLTCNHSQLDFYLKFSKQDVRFVSLNTRLWEQCQRHPRLCWKPEFITAFCRLFAFHSLKTVRLRLRFAENLLRDPSLNVRVIYLVRDPRGTLRSRNNLINWCRRNPDCIEPSRLCMDLESDYEAAVDLSERFPDTFRTVRYEDLAVDPHEMSRYIFNFLGLSYHPKVQQFLHTHTTEERPGGALNTYHDSKLTPFVWQSDMSFRKVDAIQKVCDKALEHWGYRLAHNFTHQKEFSPVGDLIFNYP